MFTPDHPPIREAVRPISNSAIPDDMPHDMPEKYIPPGVPQHILDNMTTEAVKISMDRASEERDQDKQAARQLEVTSNWEKYQKMQRDIRTTSKEAAQNALHNNGHSSHIQASERPPFTSRLFANPEMGNNMEYRASATLPSNYVRKPLLTLVSNGNRAEDYPLLGVDITISPSGLVQERPRQFGETPRYYAPSGIGANSPLRTFGTHSTPDRRDLSGSFGFGSTINPPYPGFGDLFNRSEGFGSGFGIGNPVKSTPSTLGWIPPSTAITPTWGLTAPVQESAITLIPENVSTSPKESDNHVVEETPKKVPERTLTQDEIDDRIDCVVCRERQRNTVFFPCRHLICCSTCTPSLKICPICRAVIDSCTIVYI